MKLKNCILISLGVVLVLFLLSYTGFFSNIQLKLVDNLYGGKPTLNGIAIIAIDDSSLQEIGRWPWNRENFAKVIPILSEAKTIGIDITFTESSDYESDKKFGEAIANSEVPVVLAEEYISFKKINREVLGDKIIVPIEELDSGKRGYVNIITDNDGVTRAVNLRLSDEEKSFSQMLYEYYWKKELGEDVKSSRFLINFVGKPNSFKYYSFSEVLSGKYNKSEFKDKLILIGATSPDLRDTAFVPTSSGKAMPGIEIHANTIQTLIKEDYLRESSSGANLIIMLILGLGVGIMFYRTRILWITLTSIALFIGYLIFAIKMFNYGLLMNIIYPEITIFLVYFSEISYMYIDERKSKAQIKEAFSKYVASDVVEEILKDPAKLKLGGSREEITIFFSDIRGFTSFSEKLSPEKLVHILNEYLSAMTNIILEHKGLVDKYIGDAIMAFWGAPMKNKEHAKTACEASLDMIKKLNELKKKWQKQGFPEINIGIGLNTGNAVIGNIGSSERFDYTAIGDNINLGSRLESLTKYYGVPIIISEKTKEEAGKEFITRKLDFVKVKGKNEPIKIYELIGKTGEVSKEKLEKIEIYESSLELYHKKKWDNAIKGFERLGEDMAAKEMIERCRYFKKNPPKSEWEGEWEMKGK